MTPIPECCAIVPPVPPVPAIESVLSLVCSNFVVTGTGLSSINHLLFVGVDYYDPAGPDAGLNPPGAVINEWSDTTIDITDAFLEGSTFIEIDYWGVGDVDPGNFPVVPDGYVDYCP